MSEYDTLLFLLLNNYRDFKGVIDRVGSSNLLGCTKNCNAKDGF